MKIRIGFGLGVRTLVNDERFGAAVDALEELHYDSLWVSERIGGEAPDPVVAMAYAAGRTTRLKFGTAVMVLPGRNPVLLAKELASLDRMSGGRLLPASVAALQDRIGAFIESGFSKFVVLPIDEPDPDGVPDHLAWLADNLLGLQN